MPGRSPVGVHRLQLIDSFSLRARDERVLRISSAKCRAMLAYLALAPGGVRSRLTLAECLWPSDRFEDNKANLRRELSSLRRMLQSGGAQDLLICDNSSVMIALDRVEVDVLFLEIEQEPTELIFGRIAAQNRNKGEKRVIVLIGFSDNTALGAAAPTSETPIASALRLDFDKLQDGRRYTSAMIGHLKTTALVPMPASSSPVVTALVVETEDEILALKALSSAFKLNRDSLESLIAGGKDK